MGLRLSESEQALAAARHEGQRLTAMAGSVKQELAHAQAERAAAEALSKTLQAALDEERAGRGRAEALEVELRQVRDDLADAHRRLDELRAERDQLAADRRQAPQPTDAVQAPEAPEAGEAGDGPHAPNTAATVAGLREALLDARSALVEIGGVLATPGGGPRAGSAGLPRDLAAQAAAYPVSEPPSSIDDEPDDTAAMSSHDLRRALSEARQALETERAAHTASVASHIAQSERSQSLMDERANLLEVYRGRLRRVSEVASGMREVVSATDPLAERVSDLISIARD